MKQTKNIGRVLVKGSIKQRVLLYFNSRAEEEIYGKASLTDIEYKQLYDSFKTNEEIKTFNKVLRYFREMGISVLNMKQLQFAYRETITALQGFCIRHLEHNLFSDILSAVYFSMETESDKKNIHSVLKKHSSDFLFTHFIPGQNPNEDGIIIEDGGQKIKDILKMYSERAYNQLKNAKTRLEHLKKEMEESDIDLKPYSFIVSEMEKDLRENKAPLPIFSEYFLFPKDKEDNEQAEIVDKVKQMKEEKRQRIKKNQLSPRERFIYELKKENYLFPEYDEIEIDNGGAL